VAVDGDSFLSLDVTGQGLRRAKTLDFRHFLGFDRFRIRMVEQMIAPR
jgi:hypothetical protein